MKLKGKIKAQYDKIQQDAMKKTVDGILDVVIRMYGADTSGCTLLEFIYKIKDMSAEEFYALPVPRKGEDKIE